MREIETNDVQARLNQAREWGMLQKTRHATVIGVGGSIEEACLLAEEQIEHTLRFSPYDEAIYGNGSLVVRNGANFYAIPDVALVKGYVPETAWITTADNTH